MPLARSLYLLPLGLLCTVLAAQDPAPKPAEKPAETKVEAPATKAAEVKSEAATATQDTEFRHRHHHSRYTDHSTFGAYAQGVMPLRDLKESLDKGTGYGLGVQWTHDHGDWHASRTRLEWNTFPEGDAVGGTRTYAKNYTLSWDHLFKLNKGDSQAYLVAGIGGARWYEEQNTGALRATHWTTKLAITGGIGIQLAQRVNLEARYVVSSINKTFDANTLQASLGWQF